MGTTGQVPLGRCTPALTGCSWEGMRPLMEGSRCRSPEIQFYQRRAASTRCPPVLGGHSSCSSPPAAMLREGPRGPCATVTRCCRLSGCPLGALLARAAVPRGDTASDNVALLARPGRVSQSGCGCLPGQAGRHCCDALPPMVYVGKVTGSGLVCETWLPSISQQPSIFLPSSPLSGKALFVRGGVGHMRFCDHTLKSWQALSPPPLQQNEGCRHQGFGVRRGGADAHSLPCLDILRKTYFHALCDDSGVGLCSAFQLFVGSR